MGTLSSIMDEVFPLVKTSLSKSQIFDMGAGMLSYTFDETCGFPYEHTDKTIEGKGDVVLPNTLYTNVKELHKFLFADDTYNPSDVVSHRSQKIAEMGNLDTSKDNESSQGDSNDTDAEVTDTDTPTVYNSESESYHDTQTPEETSGYDNTDNYQQDNSGYTDSSYTDNGYSDTGYSDTGYSDTGYSDGYYSEPQAQEPNGDIYQDTGSYQDSNGVQDQTWTE